MTQLLSNPVLAVWSIWVGIAISVPLSTCASYNQMLWMLDLLKGATYPPS